MRSVTLQGPECRSCIAGYGHSRSADCIADKVPPFAAMPSIIGTPMLSTCIANNSNDRTVSPSDSTVFAAEMSAGEAALLPQQVRQHQAWFVQWP